MVQRPQDPSGYGTGPFADPVWPVRGTGDLTPDPNHPFRIVRGGSYLWPATMAKANWRTEMPDDTRAPNVGLRLARTVP